MNEYLCNCLSFLQRNEFTEQATQLTNKSY